MKQSAFTLIELLVVVAVIAVLASFFAPAARRARDRGHQAYCQSQERQLVLGNTGYATDHDVYVSAATDLFTSNLRRWHGVRVSASAPFRGADGPLAPYLGEATSIRSCPAFRPDPDSDGFEAACGGYGYNAVGVGSQSYLRGFNQSGLSLAMPPTLVGPPSQTLMFSDAAFPQPYGKPTHLIEYSFAEPYYFVDWNQPAETTMLANPSIHFRHLGKSNVAWIDGHVSSESLWLRGASSAFAVGWFGEAGNHAFDLR